MTNARCHKSACFPRKQFHCKTPIKHMLVFVQGTLSKKTDLAKTF